MKCFSLNSNIKLKVLFYNDCKEASNATEMTLSVTKPDGSQVTYNEGFVNVDTGFYYYNFQAADIEGEYTHLWSATVDGAAISKEDKFKVKGGGSLSFVLPELKKNELVIVGLDAGIKAIDGSELNRKEYLTFSTQYEPFYCSVDMLLMELGPWAQDIPLDTLALAIHWSSMEGDYITSNKPVTDRHAYALSRFVMYDAAIRLLSMPMGSSGSGGSKKELGDLLVANGSLDLSLKDLLVELKLERDEWWRVVNAGGKIVSGQGLGPTFATKGGGIKEKTKVSREWHDPWNTFYSQPTANSKYRKPGESKYKSGYTRWSEYYFTNARKGITR